MNNNKKKTIGLLKYSLACPVCGWEIAISIKGYCCKNSLCTFFIPKEIRQKAITQDIVKDLIQKGQTNIINGFHKKGSSQIFSAQLFLTEKKKIRIELPDISYLNCPKCHSEMVFFERGMKCSNEDKCDFVLWNHFAGKSLTKDQMIKLLTVKKTDIIDGFVSKKNGKKYSARIVLNNRGELK
ncbi:MAG: topoisomerase C-terminal repeat-containing protein, partial [Chitinispirillia bacterium]